MPGRSQSTNRCPDCTMYRPLCMCSCLPRLETRTRLEVIMHYREVEKTTNTSRLATYVLPNSALHVRGLSEESLQISHSGYQSLLLYPGPEAEDLTPQLLERFQAPFCLIVPDGTWRQARKVRTRVAGMSDVPCVRIPPGKPSEYLLRKVPSEDRLCTFEAIARAMGVLEGPAVQQEMEKVFLVRMERILWSKGLLRPEDSRTGIPFAAIEESWRAGARGGPSKAPSS